MTIFLGRSRGQVWTFYATIILIENTNKYNDLGAVSW